MLELWRVRGNTSFPGTIRWSCLDTLRRHRLLKAGFSRRRAVLTLYALSLIFLLVAFVTLVAGGQALPIVLGCIVINVIIMAMSYHGASSEWIQFIEV